MSILINRQTRVLVQGITGNEGLFHSKQMMYYNTPVVAGVTPGKGGEWVLDGKVPIFESVRTAVEATGANATVIFVPAKHAADAIFEAVDARLPLIVCITEGVPVQDMMQVMQYVKQSDCRLIGPNCPGILTPGEAKLGIIPGSIAIPGNIGVISRSGTLTYEILYALKKAGKGVSTCVGIGGDPIKGTCFTDLLELFEADAKTDEIIIVGEVGGNDEEVTAEYITRYMTKPIYAYIAGVSAPPGKRMGHAGAIIEGNVGTAASKISALELAGVKVAKHPEEIIELMQ